MILGGPGTDDDDREGSTGGAHDRERRAVAVEQQSCRSEAIRCGDRLGE